MPNSRGNSQQELPDSQESLTKKFAGTAMKMSDSLEMAEVEEEITEVSPAAVTSGAATRSKRRNEQLSESQESMGEEHDADIEAKFNAIVQTASTEEEVIVVGLLGKNLACAVFSPQETMFAFDRRDEEQKKKVKKAIVEKAEEWRKKCPDTDKPFVFFEASGRCAKAITAVGGVDFGCKSGIPVIGKAKKIKKAKRTQRA